MVDKTVMYVMLPARLCWTCLADADAAETALLRIGSEERTTVADAIAAWSVAGQRLATSALAERALRRGRERSGHVAHRKTSIRPYTHARAHTRMSTYIKHKQSVQHL